ncbi:hypothetical protein LWI28_019255 [Acer negundo]|uniref:Retrovirus-related Pol polyprotein from transposon TNT 1-94-like beta-barrel domain-containing protein n=1 Tax=Acer negundo TaxID=4023 RepID=A0AAD5IUV0_ACENE|nr:hypothetical protein LWI28_019255 [Acer negundo]
MIDEKPILSQTHELQIIVNKLRVLKIELPKSVQVGAIIVKLPQSWKGYRKRILHKSKEMSFKNIQKHLRIEEERSRDKNDDSYAGHSKANAVNKPNHSNKHKEKFLGPKKDHRKFKKSQNYKKNRGCSVCGKPRHYAWDCKFRKKQDEEAKVNAIEEDIVATVSEINVVHGKVQDWWYDTCATIHVSYDRSLFKTYGEVMDEQEIQMGNEGRSKVVGKRSVDLVFTSRKKVTLTNVLHVPEMNRNVVSGDLLGKPGIKFVYEPGKLILSKNGVFIGKGYSCDRMVKLCTIENVNNKITPSANMIDSISLWHGILAQLKG